MSPRRSLLLPLLGVPALACISILAWPAASCAAGQHREAGDRGPALEAAPLESCFSRSQPNEDDTGLLSGHLATALPVPVHASAPRHGSLLPFAPGALARAPKHSPPLPAA